MPCNPHGSKSTVTEYAVRIVATGQRVTCGYSGIAGGPAQRRNLFSEALKCAISMVCGMGDGICTGMVYGMVRNIERK